MLSSSSQAVYTGVLSKFCPIVQGQMASRFCSSIQLWVQNRRFQNPMLPWNLTLARSICLSH